MTTAKIEALRRSCGKESCSRVPVLLSRFLKVGFLEEYATERQWLLGIATLEPLEPSILAQQDAELSRLAVFWLWDERIARLQAE